jgi:hypothetical protein
LSVILSSGLTPHFYARPGNWEFMTHFFNPIRPAVKPELSAGCRMAASPLKFRFDLAEISA